VKTGRELRLNLKENDFNDMLKCHAKELSKDDYRKLECHGKKKFQR
jgi:hypothetical protein